MVTLMSLLLIVDRCPHILTVRVLLRSSVVVIIVGSGRVSR